MQKLYDFNFRQLELSIREIGYGDQSINKKMKDYINLFHGIISDIHFWDDMEFSKKKRLFNKIFSKISKILNQLVEYFNDFSSDLIKNII